MSSVDRTHPNADKSVVFKGFGGFAKGEDVKPMTYNPPALADDFVDIKITCCGVCGSDIHTLDSGWGPTNYPVIVGHEIVGTVAAIGKNVTHIKVGDRVGVGAQCGCDLACPECKSGNENHCRQTIWTYNSAYTDGQISQGGYADRIRCQALFAFKIPEGLSSAEAAPLMCGGATVFAPLKRHITKPGMKVAVIGVGGLGHMAIAFAAKLGAHVTAVARNDSKIELAKKLGASAYLNTSDKAQVAAAFRSFDLILCTANGDDNSFNTWFSFVAFDGTFCNVGIPEGNIAFHPFSVLGNRMKYVASAIGSVAEVKETLEFAAQHGVHPIIQTYPMSEANKAIATVRDGSVRFRAVLEN